MKIEFKNIFFLFRDLFGEFLQRDCKEIKGELGYIEIKNRQFEENTLDCLIASGI